MISTRTPGPWTATPPCREDQQYHWTIRGPGSSPPVISFEIARLSSANTPELEHDARLIAAAPDLLEALKEIEKYMRADFDDMPMSGKARAAIAKATGGKP